MQDGQRKELALGFRDAEAVATRFQSCDCSAKATSCGTVPRPRASEVPNLDFDFGNDVSRTNRAPAGKI